MVYKLRVHDHVSASGIDPHKQVLIVDKQHLSLPDICAVPSRCHQEAHRLCVAGACAADTSVCNDRCPVAVNDKARILDIAVPSITVGTMSIRRKLIHNLLLPWPIDAAASRALDQHAALTDEVARVRVCCAADRQQEQIRACRCTVCTLQVSAECLV